MKKKIIIGIVILLVVILIGIYFIKNNQNKVLATENKETTISEVKATKMTITKTLSNSGQVESALTEKLYLHATYYFEEIYVTENSAVKEGENILKYTNGTYLTAPYDCVISSISVPAEDEMCTNNQYIEVQTTETLQLNLSLDETEIGNISIGQEANIKVNVNLDKTYSGWVTNINEIATYSSNGSTFDVTVTFANDNTIKLGMSASCDIILDKAEDVIAVPIEAIQTQNKSKYVVLVNSNGTTENRTVETGISNEAYIEVKSGLQENEAIQLVKETSKTSKGMQFRNFQGGKQNNGSQKGSGQQSNGGQQMSGQGSMTQMQPK